MRPRQTAAGGTTGPQGTPGGQSTAARPGIRLSVAWGPEVYLWVLVGLELAATAWLRHSFRTHHGG